MQCNSCKIPFETQDEFAEHLRENRRLEAELSWSDPRYRILLALTGVDHGVPAPEVTRRAFTPKRAV